MTLTTSYTRRKAGHAPIIHVHFNLVLMALAAGRTQLLQLCRIGDMDTLVLQELERVIGQGLKRRYAAGQKGGGASHSR